MNDPVVLNSSRPALPNTLAPLVMAACEAIDAQSARRHDKGYAVLRLARHWLPSLRRRRDASYLRALADLNDDQLSDLSEIGRRLRREARWRSRRN